MNENGLNVVFKMIKLTSKAVFYHLYQNILPLFTINWPLFLEMDKKAYFLSKISSLFFRGNVPNVQQCPQCATLFWGVQVLHIGCTRCSINIFYQMKTLIVDSESNKENKRVPLTGSKMKNYHLMGANMGAPMTSYKL